LKLLLVTDCWKPYVSGYVRTFSTVVDHIRELGHEVDIISPYMFRTVPFPFCPEFPVPVFVRRKVVRLIEESNPDAIHLGAEGPLGMAARRWCRRNSFPFTTSFTTKQPEYLNKWFGFPISWGYKYMRRFHAPASAVMVSTQSMMRELEGWGFKNLALWSRGVDLELFHPRPKDFLSDARPISMFVGRVAKEKNIPAFLDLDVSGTKYVVGGGPMLKSLKKRYPNVKFTGNQSGEELARYYAAADVVVFPSRLDTFGLVLLEALASGTPVAGFPVTGPIDVVGKSDVDVLDEDLADSVRRALEISPERCRAHAETYSWEESTRQFLNNLQLRKSGGAEHDSARLQKETPAA
jgi:glycosyltransferase involved in cell wall biosynthesis